VQLVAADRLGRTRKHRAHVQMGEGGGGSTISTAPVGWQVLAVLQPLGLHGTVAHTAAAVQAAPCVCLLQAPHGLHGAAPALCMRLRQARCGSKGCIRAGVSVPQVLQKVHAIGLQICVPLAIIGCCFGE
jgi:hypothetical protein